MLSGKEKAQVLLSSLGAKASAILKLLSPESAALLTNSIADTPQAAPNELSDLFDEIISSINQNPSIGKEIAPDSEQTEEIQTEPTEESYQSENNQEEEIDNPNPETPVLTPDKDAIKIARILSKQKPQIIAFFLTKVDKDLSKEIYSNLPINLQENVESAAIESIPLSDSVFQHLYDGIINYKENEQEETENDSNEFSSSSDDSNFGSSSDFGSSFGDSDFSFSSTNDESSPSLLSDFGNENNNPISLLDDTANSIDEISEEPFESMHEEISNDSKEKEFSL